MVDGAEDQLALTLNPHFFFLGAGCFWKLAGNSVVLKVEGRNEQWYYDRLVPWVHFVPVRADLSDLDNATAFVLNPGNDVELKAMASESTKLMRSLLDRRAAATRVKHFLNAYFLKPLDTGGGASPSCGLGVHLLFGLVAALAENQELFADLCGRLSPLSCEALTTAAANAVHTEDDTLKNILPNKGLHCAALVAEVDSALEKDKMLKREVVREVVRQAKAKASPKEKFEQPRKARSLWKGPRGLNIF